MLAETNQSDLRFVRSLTLAHATDPAAEILIAYEMNGQPLTPDHGAPFRLIVPQWYAVASVKWLQRIDVLTEPYVGEFQTGHYIYEWPDREHERVTMMRVRARITDPAPGATIATGEYTVRGKAWSGTGPVTDVDVSFTGEGDWHPAKLEPPKSPYQWQDWSLDWDASDIGRHSLRARATDAAGNVQPDVPPWNRLGDRKQRNRGLLRRRALTPARRRDAKPRPARRPHPSLPETFARLDANEVRMAMLIGWRDIRDIGWQ